MVTLKCSTVMRMNAKTPSMLTRDRWFPRPGESLSLSRRGGIARFFDTKRSGRKLSLGLRASWTASSHVDVVARSDQDPAHITMPFINRTHCFVTRSCGET